jgi:hypothetical protein
MAFKDGVAIAELHTVPGSPFVQQFRFFPSPLAILGNNSYYQYPIIAALYDWAVAGP